MKLKTLLALTVLAFNLAAARADSYPKGPVKVIVPFSAGSTGDLVIRMLGPKLEEQLGQKLIVENRVGAGGNVGTAAVVSAPPDGQTLLFTAMHNFVINQHIYKTMRFDPITTLAPISKVIDLPYVMYASGASHWRSVKDVVEGAKTRPVFFASSGVGTAPHLAGVLFSRMAGVKLTHVPYPGNPQSVQALMTDQVQLYFASASASQGHVGTGPRDVWPVLVAWDQRLPEFPDTPTSAEAGIPQLRISNWWGLAAPAGTPAETIDLLNKAVRLALADPQVATQLRTLGMTPVGDTPSEFRRAIREESERWAQLIKAERIEAD